jgi:hypothetical protein
MSTYLTLLENMIEAFQNLATFLGKEIVVTSHDHVQQTADPYCDGERTLLLEAANQIWQ